MCECIILWIARLHAQTSLETDALKALWKFSNLNCCASSNRGIQWHLYLLHKTYSANGEKWSWRHNIGNHASLGYTEFMWKQNSDFTAQIQYKNCSDTFMHSPWVCTWLHPRLHSSTTTPGTCRPVRPVTPTSVYRLWSLHVYWDTFTLSAPLQIAMVKYMKQLYFRWNNF